MKSLVLTKWAGVESLRSLQYMVKERTNRVTRGTTRRFHKSAAYPAMLFMKELLDKPRTIGAICPSSLYLARCMAEQIPHGDGLVVELGAGTGMVTRAIINALPKAQKRLWAVEQSATLAALLCGNFPEVNVVRGDARELADILPPAHHVDVIISGLPLRAFSQEDVASITQQWHKVLAPDGFVVQFTYALWHSKGMQKHGFEEVGHRTVWKNVPPARVQILKKISPSSEG